MIRPDTEKEISIQIQDLEITLAHLKEAISLNRPDITYPLADVVTTKARRIERKALKVLAERKFK